MMDEAWMRAFRGEDRNEQSRMWEEAFLRHRDVVYRVCLHVLADPALAEDVTQETFLRAHRYGASFRGESTLRGWLVTIATNLARRAVVRERARHPASDPTAVHAPPDVPLERQERRDQLSSALLQLPLDQRMAVTLSCVEGLTAGEIGRVIGCPEGTVWSRIYHARRRLGEILARMDSEVSHAS